MKLRYKTYSQCGTFPLPCYPRESMESLYETPTGSSSENIQLLEIYIVTYRKKLEEVVFVKENFLHKKISNKEVTVDYGAMTDISENAVEQNGDLTALK